MFVESGKREQNRIDICWRVERGGVKFEDTETEVSRGKKPERK